MNAPGGVGLTFRETMSGAFSLGALDPEVGARAGAATPLTLNAAIRLDDVAAFVADPRHLGQLSGTVDFAPFGPGPLASESGVFGLFTPSGDPALTYMVYEMGFRRGDERFYLAGKKHVRVGPPQRLWTETTTLYSTLHAGADATGAVVGAGTLHLGVLELLALLTTVRALDAPTTSAGVAAVARFFRFFAAELARTYVRRMPLGAP